MGRSPLPSHQPGCPCRSRIPPSTALPPSVGDLGRLVHSIRAGIGCKRVDSEFWESRYRDCCVPEPVRERELPDWVLDWSRLPLAVRSRVC